MADADDEAHRAFSESSEAREVFGEGYDCHLASRCPRACASPGSGAWSGVSGG